VRVALVSGPDPGHLIPIAGIAAQLRDAGHDIVVVTSDRWAAPLERDGLEFLSLPLIAATAGDQDVAHRLHVRPVEMAGPLVADLRGLNLDLVVSDTLTRVGAVAAGILDLPWAELIPHPLPDPSVALPPFGTGWTPRPRRDRRYASRNAASRALGERQKHAALAAAGLVDVPPVHRLVATLPALEPGRPDWPAATTLVVPPAWEPAASDLEPPAGDGPLVLVVGSTASTGPPVDLLAATVAALAATRSTDRPWRVVSPRFGPRVTGLPSWVAAGPGRLSPLLGATAVTVASGGHGMVVASLRAGVPLVLLPGPGDQKEVAARTARVGAATRLDRLRTRSLGRAIGSMHGPEPSLAASRAGGVAGLAEPVAILESLVR
jgi:UDP:flavonoid glycosyltransferase YjiC (YdhE family)